MNLTKTRLNVYKLILGIFFSTFLTSVQALCTFSETVQDNKNGTITDLRTGYTWKRCVEGASWNGISCSENGKKINWPNSLLAAKGSKFLGKNDWKLPTKAEFVAVFDNLNCGTNHNVQYPPQDWMWTTTPDIIADHPEWPNANITSFYRRVISTSLQDGENYVLLIRGNVSTEFDTQIKKFSSHNLAVKDFAEKDKNDKESRETAYKRNSTTRKSCEAQKQTCLASCGDAMYWRGKERVENPTSTYCRNQCNQILCN